jgi:hypothetical protein
MRYRLRTLLILLAYSLRTLLILMGIAICAIVGCNRKGTKQVPDIGLEMSKEDRERWYASDLPRFGVPSDYLPPNTIDTMPCDYTKGDMHDILIFTVKGTLDEIGKWYTTRLPIHIYDKNDYDPGQLTLYSLSDRDLRSYSVILADSETQQATGNFGSYVGPEYLERMIQHRPCIIGAIYLSEDGWYERNRTK